MTRFVKLGAALAAVAMIFAGCELIDDGGGGGGGGGGISTFTRGFVFVRADDRNVYAADSSDYNTIARLTTSGNNKHPSLSKDGKQVVFVNQAGATSTLQAVALAGGDPRTLLTSDATFGKFATPVFSPDGTKVVFTFERSGSTVLASVNADGTGELTELSTGTLSYLSPSFYPDGKHVLVAAGNLASGFTQLEKVNLDTGTPQNVLNDLGNEAEAIRNRVVLSKDGTLAAFDAQVSSGVTRIFVANLATGAVTQLTDHPGDTNANDSFPTWFSSSEVAFSSDSGGNDQVYVVGANETKQAGSLTLPSAVEPWFGPL